MKHLALKDIHPDNWHLYQEKPDRNFSPQRTEVIINQVLKENDEMQTKVRDSVQKNAGNVADILASFAKYKLDEGKGKQIEEWLGPHWMAKIYGDKLIEKIRMAEILKDDNRKKGNTKFSNFYLK